MKEILAELYEKLWQHSTPWTRRILIIVGGVVTIAAMYFGVIK